MYIGTGGSVEASQPGVQKVLAAGGVAPLKMHVGHGVASDGVGGIYIQGALCQFHRLIQLTGLMVGKGVFGQESPIVRAVGLNALEQR